LTWRVPVTGAGGQFNPASDRSTSPDTFRHDDITVQVPTTLPPQTATLVQVPPPVELPPVPLLPELPPVPDEEPELALHAADTMPSATAMATTADWIFIGLLL